MAKSIENAYRQMDITLANQLSLAFPNENIREVLKLVGTKWNVNTYFPGLGTGGYCIPLSSQYVLNHVKNKNSLTLLRETIKTDKLINLKIARSLAKKKFKKVGVLGLSYKGNLKVNILSPVIPFVKELLRKKIKVEVFDPYYSKQEIKKILKTNSFRFPYDLKKFDCIVITADHNEFKIEKKIINKFLKKNTFILDFCGIWKKYNLNKFEKKYVISGEKNWIS
jgi:nucleotide sugar dehydrogenase